MNSRELVSILGVAGIPARIQRDEVVIQVCVFCTNSRWNLECNAEKAVYHAWCCKRGGRLDQLLRDLTGSEYRLTVQRAEKDPTTPPPAGIPEFKSRPVAEVPSAMAYLAKRSIDPAVVLRYGMVFVDQPGHQLHGRIALPAREYWSSEIAGWTGRTYTGQWPKYITTLHKKIITGWKQRDARAPAVIVEGPFDGVAVHRAGYHAVVLSGVGTSGIDEWASRFAPDVPVAIMLDSEAQAQEQARQLFWKISAVRERPPIMAVLPEGQDPAEMGPRGIAELVTKLLSTDQRT